MVRDLIVIHDPNCRARHDGEMVRMELTIALADHDKIGGQGPPDAGQQNRQKPKSPCQACYPALCNLTASIISDNYAKSQPCQGDSKDYQSTGEAAK